MGLRCRVDPCAHGVRICALAIVGREGRRQFERRLRRFAAPALERPAGCHFFVLPWPSLRIVDARLDDVGGVNFLSAPTARLDLSLVELARGRFIPTLAVLVSPTITLDIDRPPFAGRRRLRPRASRERSRR